MDADYFKRFPDMMVLKEYCELDGAQLVYVRGRRRVGKSWLLKNFAQKTKNSFYYMGAADTTAAMALQDFARAWDDFSKTSQLSQLRPSALSWSGVFEAISLYLKTNKKNLVLILDEIQWIAKMGSGFVGKLKEAWIDWERLGNIKVILCGSSNKFFCDYAGGEEKILRGMKTQATIWVKPFTLGEVRKHYFSQWRLEEAILTYMMTGGIPYYLNQLDAKLGFVHAINQAFFVKTSPFLEEVSEILDLEFNRAGRNTVKTILSTLGQDGTTQQRIVQKTGLSPSSVSETLEKLVDYELVFDKLPAHQKSTKRGAGYFYFMKDFFLNFYFQVLEPLQAKVSENKSGLLFPCEILSKNGYYIPNFSGKAFELLIRYQLENFSLYKKSKLFKKLMLVDSDYQVMTYWNDETQVDLIVEHKLDRVSRIIECKWINEMPHAKADSLIDEILAKKYEPPAGFTKKYFLILATKPSTEFMASAKARGVSVISLEDLVG